MSIDADAEIRALRTVLRDLVALLRYPGGVDRQRTSWAVAAGLAECADRIAAALISFSFVCAFPVVDGRSRRHAGGTHGKRFPGMAGESISPRAAGFSSMEVIPDVGGRRRAISRCVVIPVGVKWRGQWWQRAC